MDLVHGILQARILDWVAFPFARESSQPRDQTQVSHIVGRFFTSWATPINSVQRPLGFLASRWLSLPPTLKLRCCPMYWIERFWVACIIKMIEIMELELLRPFPPQLCKLEWRDKMSYCKWIFPVFIIKIQPRWGLFSCLHIYIDFSFCPYFLISAANRW